jgi:hypothetical protein
MALSGGERCGGTLLHHMAGPWLAIPPMTAHMELNHALIATKYIRPALKQINVISALQTWLISFTVNPRNERGQPVQNQLPA